MLRQIGLLKVKIYKIAQNQDVVIYTGDSEPVDTKDFDPEYGIKQLGKEQGASAAWGPGIYFTGQEDIAYMYGSNITKKVLNSSRILTPESPLFDYKKIDNMINGVDKRKVSLAISNWSEDYSIGKRMLIQSIVDEENVLLQIMNIWSEVFPHQDANLFIDLMVKNGIDGISIKKNDNETYYVIYNKMALLG